MNYQKELTFAQQLAKQAGAIMQRYFRAADTNSEWKEDHTPLTIADTAVNNLVIEQVKKYFPDHGVLGEEASFEPQRQLIWVVDPIDGTMPYSIGIPISTFSLALVDRTDGQPVVGIVLDPHLDHLYTSVRDQGAFLNGQSLHTASVTNFTHTYVSVIGGTMQGEQAYLTPGICSDILREQGAKCLCLFSQIYSAARVASGELAGSIFGYGSPWDSAAVSLLVEEAGGIVTDLTGKPRRHDEFSLGCILAANETILAKLLKAVRTSAP